MLLDDVAIHSVHTAGSVKPPGSMHMPKGDPATANLHREWLRSLKAHTGHSLSRIADEVGVARSTLTRPLKDGDDGVSTLHALTIEKVVTKYRVAPPSVPELTPAAPAGVVEDATPYRPQAGDEVAAAVKALTGSRRNADAWVMRSRALECAGVMPGDVVIVDMAELPRAGDLACAQVYDWRKGTAETIFRVYEPPYLVASTFDPGLRKPLLVDDERVIIKGVLLPHRLRLPRH